MKLEYPEIICLILTVFVVAGGIEATVLINNEKILYKTLFFGLYIFSTLIISYIFYKLIRIKKLNNNHIDFQRTDEFSNKEILIITFVSATIFLYFIHSNIREYSLIGFAQFSEEYRNSIYKGSGVYTVLATIVLPLMLSYNIAFGKKFSYIFFTSLLILFVCVAITGMRIFLAPLLLATLYRFLQRKTPILNYIVLIFIIIIISIFVKLFLAQINEDNIDYLSFVLNPLIRLHIPYLINYNFGYGTDTLSCTLPFFQYLGECDSEEIKYQLMRNSSDLIDGFPNLSKYSGLAIPLPVYLYNIFGFLSLPLLVIYIVILKIIYAYIPKKENSRLTRFLLLGIILNMSAAILEDFLILARVDLYLVLSCIIIIITKYPNKKLIKIFFYSKNSLDK